MKILDWLFKRKPRIQRRTDPDIEELKREIAIALSKLDENRALTHDIMVAWEENKKFEEQRLALEQKNAFLRVTASMTDEEFLKLVKNMGLDQGSEE